MYYELTAIALSYSILSCFFLISFCLMKLFIANKKSIIYAEIIYVIKIYTDVIKGYARIIPQKFQKYKHIYD